MADHGLDGRSASEFALDGTEDAALLSGDEDATRVLRIMPADALVDIAALDLEPVSLWVSSMTSRRV
jgi:hypothetical protein